jgi:CRISPR system Cascade subunit CasE
MYLSQLFINLRDRRARFDLSDRYELHRTLMCGFPEQLPDDERVLYRVDEAHRQPHVSILVQSQLQPTWDNAERLNDSGYLCDAPVVRQIQPNVQNGVRLPFRLQANPTVKRNGKRQAIYADDALMTWLERKGSNHGFTVDPLNFRHMKLGKKYGKKRAQTWHAVQFDGVLTVVQTEAFRQALMRGIGSAKSFGFGLLSIPYPRA